MPFNGVNVVCGSSGTFTLGLRHSKFAPARHDHLRSAVRSSRRWFTLRDHRRQRGESAGQATGSAHRPTAPIRWRSAFPSPFCQRRPYCLPEEWSNRPVACMTRRGVTVGGDGLQVRARSAGGGTFAQRTRDFSVRSWGPRHQGRRPPSRSRPAYSPGTAFEGHPASTSPVSSRPQSRAPS